MQISNSEDIVNPIYKFECPISESIQQRSSETGIESGKNLWAKPYPDFFYKLQLIGKGLDINP